MIVFLQALNNYNNSQISDNNYNQQLQFRNFDKDDIKSNVKTVLGKKRINPFEISNINRALTYLYGNRILPKSPTHEYIKFTPNTQQHLAELEDWAIINNVGIFDFPLEYEITNMGDYYFDPAVTDSVYTYRYSSVPKNITFPNVPYIVIDELYLDFPNVFLIAESFWMTGNINDINEYVFHGGVTQDQIDNLNNQGIIIPIIPDKPDEPCPPGYDWRLVIDDSQIDNLHAKYIWMCMPIEESSGSNGSSAQNDCGCDLPYYRHPAGCVRVDYDAVFDPVQNAHILVKDTWFTYDVAQTSDQGCWEVNEDYSGKVWMWVIFHNEDLKVRDTRFWESIPVVINYIGKFTAPPYNNINIAYNDGGANNTSFERICWAAAHTINTVNQYRQDVATDGLLNIENFLTGQIMLETVEQLLQCCRIIYSIHGWHF